MKVVFVVPSYPSAYCGISTYSDYLIKELEKLVEVEILGASSSQSAFRFLKNVAGVVKDADIIHVQHSFELYGYMGYLTFPLYHILRRAGKPTVTTIHELPELKSKDLKVRFASPYLRACVNEMVQNSAGVIVHTKATLDLLAQWRLSKNVHLIPHGSIRPKLADRSASSRRNGPTVGFFGFISENKGTHRLLEALVQLPDTRLVIAGEPRTDRDQKYYLDLRSQAVNLGLADRVEFRGFLPDSALADFFQSVDVVAFPYSSCTASGALHLALAHGGVVLTSNLPVFHELKVKYDCLEEFDAEEPETLVTQLNRLLRDDTRRSELIAGGRRLAEETNWVQVAQKTYTLYENILAEHCLNLGEPSLKQE